MRANRFTWMAIAAAVVALLSGAWDTSLTNGPNTAPVGLVHVILGLLFLALALPPAWFLSRSGAARAAASIVVGVLLAVGSGALGHSAAVLHACLAPIALAALAMAFTRPEKGESDPETRGLVARIRIAALLTPALAWMQIVFGALYRHKVWGILPHMAGALLVSLPALIVCSIILQRVPQKGPLRSAAGALLAAVLTQVTLGVSAFIMRLLDADGTLLYNTVASLHVVTGSAVFASAALLAVRTQKIAVGESQ